MFTATIITFACSIVNPLGLEAASQKRKEALQDIIDLLMEEGGQAEIYSGPLAQDLELPDPAPTKTIDAVPLRGAAGGEEEVTDNLSHGCSMLVEQTTAGTPLPAKFIFQARLKSGGDSETYYFRTGLDGTLEKAMVTHGKLDKNGKPIRGSANNSFAFLDIESAEVKSRLQHELDLWLTGKYFKKKFRKKHLEDLAYYRNKRNPPPQKTKKAAEKTPAHQR